MKLDFSGAFAEALALFRRDRDVHLWVAAFFFFLPAFAGRLFLPEPQVADLDPDATMTALLQWFADNAHWIAAQVLVQLLGVGTLLVLLLDSARPTIAQALMRALRLLPWLLLAQLLSLALVMLGTALFVLPGFYAIGRTFLTMAILVAEPERGPFGAFGASIARTHQLGWLLALMAVVVYIASSVPASVGAPASLPLAKVLLDAIGAASVAAGGLAQVLLQIAVYRQLAAPRQGM